MYKKAANLTLRLTAINVKIKILNIINVFG